MLIHISIGIKLLNCWPMPMCLLCHNHMLSLILYLPNIIQLRLLSCWPMPCILYAIIICCLCYYISQTFYSLLWSMNQLVLCTRTCHDNFSLLGFFKPKLRNIIWNRNWESLNSIFLNMKSIQFCMCSVSLHNILVKSKPIVVCRRIQLFLSWIRFSMLHF